VAKRLSLLQLLMSIINRVRKVWIIIFQKGNTQPPSNHYITIMYVMEWVGNEEVSSNGRCIDRNATICSVLNNPWRRNNFRNSSLLVARIIIYRGIWHLHMASSGVLMVTNERVGALYGRNSWPTYCDGSNPPSHHEKATGTTATIPCRTCLLVLIPGT